MYLKEEVEITINPSNIKHYYKKYKDIKVRDIILVKIDDLSVGSHTIIVVKCDDCGLEKKIKYCSYIKNYNNGDYLCISCKRKKNNMKKYGVENVFQLESIKEKSQKTCFEKYGVNNISKSEEIKIQKKNTIKEKYGVEHHLQNPEILEKQMKTNEKRYGVNNISKLNNIKDKKIITCLKNYGVEHFSQSQNWKDMIKEKKMNELNNKLIEYNITNYKIKPDGNLIIKCENEQHEYEINSKLLQERIERYKTIPCTICNPINIHSSGKEKQLEIFIKNIYDGEIILSDRKQISPQELDIYLPELNLAFEFNGVYWHNELYKEKNYHLNKTNSCLEKGIQLIHVWEDDWNHKQDIVKSMILNKLNKTQNKIYARKCEIKEITDNKLVRDFLDKNHIQGFVGSSIKIGLFYENELVSLMTFKKSKTIELNRFCNKINTNIIGGASKLFKYFINNFDFDEIVSFSNNSYSNGKIYEKLNFQKTNKLKPDYSYIVDNIRRHKFNFRKSKLKKLGYNIEKSEKKLCLINNIYRVFDAGKIKWLYKK
jgi:hypothetical protein